MDGWWTIADVTAALAAALLICILTWAARVRSAAHHWAAGRPSIGAEVRDFMVRSFKRVRGLDAGRAVRHARRIHAAFGGLA
jgi:hypothetical protein